MTTPLERNLISRQQLEESKYSDLYEYKAHYDGEYQDVFGKIPLNSEAFRMYGYRKPFGYLADIPDIDKNFVNAMNYDLPKDNSLRQIIDTDKDGKLSVNEVEGFFNNFTNGTNKLSGSQLDNLFFLQNNAIDVDSLFDADGRRGKSLRYDDVVGKSIIKKDDFDMLDMADGKKDGIIQKDTFKKFDFDTNKDGIIDRDEYQAGMQRIEASLQNEKFDFDTNKDGIIDRDEFQAGMQRVEALLRKDGLVYRDELQAGMQRMEASLPNNMECDNGKSDNNLSSMQKDKPIISE